MTNSDYSGSDMEVDVDEVVILSPPPPATLATASFPTPTAAAYRSSCTVKKVQKIAGRFQVPPEYELRAPTADERAHNPPAGYAAVYTDQFKNGLRLPLPVFIVAVLEFYQIALAQLHPNSVVALLGFMSICLRLSIAPTISLLRFFFTLRKGTKDGDAGWYTFYPRAVKLVHGRPSTLNGWKSAFLFFKTKAVAEHPNFNWTWNLSPVRDPMLADHEWLSEEMVDRFKASVVVQKPSSALQSKEEGSVVEKGVTKAATEMQSKNTPTKLTSCEVPKTAPCRQRKLKRLEDLYAATPAKALKGIEGSSHQKYVRSFHLQLQGEKEELEKIIEAKDQKLKAMETEIASLKEDKKELEEENASLKAKVSSLQIVKDDHGFGRGRI